MRDIPVGNGSFLVNFDDKYQIRDIYFPHVGQENHTEGYPCRFGVWVDGRFSWIADDEWTRDLRYLPDTLVTDIALRNDRLQVGITASETVASHENIFLRRVRIRNAADTKREFRVFHHHDFRIYENKFGDTAFFDPDTFSIIHYKKHRYFLIGTKPMFGSFSTGRKAFKSQEGTWRDAEDGSLQGNVITEGSVDSTIGVRFVLEPNGVYEFFYWITAGASYDEVVELDGSIKERTPEVYIGYAENYWRAWVNKQDGRLEALDEKVIALFRRSLLMIHSQIDNGGAILAANDHDVADRATDHYSYLWTRDGAFVANALDSAGYSYITRKFFDMCARIVHPDGYFLQKYNPDGTLASGWHPCWDPQTSTRLVPIQEDETALVLWALWEHYERFRDVEFSHRLYRSLVIRCADFMARFRDEETGLPQPSWNLWENSRGIHTFTCATVVAGLRAAANFADVFAESTRAERYRTAADEILTGVRRNLYSTSDGKFFRSLIPEPGGELRPDRTIDASLFGIFYFDCFEVDDPMVEGTMRAIEERLVVNGGIGRFENDDYMRRPDSRTGNAWIICTLWLAEYYIRRAAKKQELLKALELIEWVVGHALPSGVLSEQIGPDGEQLSVSPLTWSHSTFVATVLSFQQRAEELKVNGSASHFA